MPGPDFCDDLCTDRVNVPVPRVVEQDIELPKVVSKERILQSTVEIVDVPMLQVVADIVAGRILQPTFEKIVDVLNVEQLVDFPVSQVQMQIVEVGRVVLCLLCISAC